MCGVPYHAAEGYIGKLIRKGFKVAICEQMEDPRLAKKLVRREVTRVVTPGTAADSSLGSEENNFLAALAQVGQIAWDSRRWICRPESFGLRSFPARVRCGGCRRSWSSCGRRSCCMGRRRRCLRVGSCKESRRALLGRTARTGGCPARSSAAIGSQLGRLAPRLRWTIGFLRRTTRMPLLENHFGVLSLEGFGLAGQTGCGFGGGRDSLLRALDAARIARSRGPHWVVRAAELPGARCGHGAQSGVDRAVVCGNGCWRDVVPLDRCGGHAHGQAVAAGVAAAAVA